MKTKYFLIYVFVGIAFLAVSAWVFFTHGNNPRAIRAKYKLGGILLMCLSMLSAASCGWIHGPGEVTCYDVAVIEPTENIVHVDIKCRDASYKYGEISPGDLFTVDIQVPTYRKYLLRVILNNTEGTELQRAELVIPETGNAQFEIPLSDAVTYKGEALVQIQGVEKEDPEELSQMAYGIQVLNIR